MEGLMSEEAFALLLLEPCQLNAENTIEKPLTDLPITNTQFQPDEQYKSHDPDEAASNQDTGSLSSIDALIKSCNLKSNLINTHARSIIHPPFSDLRGRIGRNASFSVSGFIVVAKNR